MEVAGGAQWTRALTPTNTKALGSTPTLMTYVTPMTAQLGV